MASIPYYADPAAESVLRMGPSGGAPVLVSNAAHVSARLENGFDEQTKGGSNFGRSKFLGIKPAAFTVTFDVLPEEEADFWTSVAPLLRQKGKKGNAPPMAVVNPQINRWGINTVTVLSADVDPPAAGLRSVTIQLKEWTPAPVAPNPATSGVTNRDPLNLAPGAAAANQ